MIPLLLQLLTKVDGRYLMKDKFLPGRSTPGWLFPLLVGGMAIGLLVLIFPAGAGAEQIKEKVKEKIKGLKAKLEGPAAKCIKVPGVLFTQGLGKSWQAIQPDQTIPAGQTVVALPSAEIHSLNDAVEVLLVADIANRGPFPVLETAVAFRPHPQADLEVILQRGIIILGNRKPEGEVKVVLDIHGQVMELTLREPGTRLAVEIFSRQAPGKPKVLLVKQEEPNTNLMFLALKGRVLLGTEKQSNELRAPPGPAMLLWDNVTKTPELKRLDKLPDFAKEHEAKDAKLFEEICQLARKLPGPDVSKALRQLAHSENKDERELAVVGLGALDQVSALLEALADDQHADLRDHAVIVLRHWLGRSAGQLAKLQLAMLKEKRYTVIQARLILHLLLGFTDREKSEPATYDFLIHLLDHPQLAVRELVRWHLVRLAPAGKEIPFDAAAPAADRQRAVAQWRALIPSGQLPPPVRGSSSKTE